MVDRQWWIGSGGLMYVYRLLYTSHLLLGQDTLSWVAGCAWTDVILQMFRKSHSNHVAIILTMIICTRPRSDLGWYWGYYNILRIALHIRITLCSWRYWIGWKHSYAGDHPPTHDSLLTTLYSLLTTAYSLLTTYYCLLTTYYLLSTTH